MSHHRQYEKNQSNLEKEYERVTIAFKLMHPDATIPFKSTPGAVGYDLCSPLNVILSPRECIKIDTMVMLKNIPKDCFAQICSKSGLAFIGINAKPGIIDIDYTGTICVTLENITSRPYEIMKYEKIAQLVFFSYKTNDVIGVIGYGETEMKFVTGVKANEQRGSGGYGSTGRFANATHKETTV